MSVVVGNPQADVAHRAAAELIATKLVGEAPTAGMDVIDLGAGLLGLGDLKVAGSKATVLSADCLVVASPTFKGT